jgi:hypothetical protein
MVSRAMLLAAALVALGGAAAASIQPARAGSSGGAAAALTQPARAGSSAPLRHTRPAFSWATVPVFIHTSVLNSGLFSPEDLDIVARFPAITIEKWHSCNSTGCFDPQSPGGMAPNPSGPCPTQDEGALAAAAQIKARNASAAVFIW